MIVKSMIGPDSLLLEVLNPSNAKGYFRPKHNTKIFVNHLNPVMLVFIG